MDGNLNNDQKFISKLTEIILANIGDGNFGIEELARESGLSRNNLNQRLRSITNKSINQIIRETRLHKAMEMLQNGNVTASEVAYKVGFSSPAYFNTCFHEFFGYPPGQVNKISLHKQEEINTFQASGKQVQKRSARRTVIYITSGLLFIAVIVLLFYDIFLKHSHYYATTTFVKDIDGNIYNTITIGTQEWMAEDLKTTKYNDGAPIPYITEANAWMSLHSGAFRWANNEYSKTTERRALYNWYSTATGKLCPVGWHVSTDMDWDRLVDYCGGWEIAGGKLKEAGTKHWDSPNVGATNEFGFNALPIDSQGRNLGYWCPPRVGDFRSLCSDRAWIYLTQSTTKEASCVRCVKNK